MARQGVLYKKIVNYMIDEINSNRLNQDDKIMTEEQLCEAFDVSRITTIKALKELQGLGYIYRIKGKGSYVAAIENHRKRRSNLIGLVVSYDKQLEPDFLNGLERTIRNSGFYLTINNTENDYGLERAIINRLSNEADGLVLFVQPNEERNIDVFSDLIIQQKPVVLIDAKLDEYEMPYLTCNNKKAFFDLTNYVIECGHQKIAYVGSGSKSYYSTFCRYQGYCSALIQAGISLKMEYIYDHFIDLDKLRKKSQNDMDEQHKEAADRAIDYFLSLDKPPTALMAVNDITAINLMYAALRRGIAVPDDLSITGFDNLAENKYLPIQLTTVDQQFRTLGEKAAKLVLNQVSGSYLLETKHENEAKIMIRDSVRKIKT